MRILRLVRDHEDGEDFRLLHRADEVQHVAPERGAQRREGLVQQEHRPVPHQGAGDGDALALAARDFAGLALCERAEANLGQRGIRIPRDLSLIILDDNPILRHALPAPARYVKNALRFSTLLRRALDSTLEDSGRQRGEARMVPELEQGDTLGAPAG